MTPRQKQVIDFIESFTASNGYPPTVREVGEGVGLQSTSTVMGHLYKLRDAALVTWQEYSPRTLKVVKHVG